MTNKKTTRRALVLSLLSLLVCCSMLVGTTFAWFTDSVQSGNNKIVAGNLDVEVYYGDPDAKNSIESVATLFNGVTLWEPGAVAYENLTVVNEGTLALKYQLSINFTGENTVDGYGLSQILKVGLVEGGVAANATREQAVEAVEEWLPMASFTESGDLDAGEVEKTVGVVIYWEPSAEDNNWNVNNGKTVSDYAETQKNELHIDLGIELYATQLVQENDSFGPDYDENAAMVVTSADALAEALANGGSIKLDADITTDESLVIPAGKTVALDLNGKTITGSMHKNDGAVITNNGTLTLTGGTVSSTAANGGSALKNNGTATVKDATLNGAPNEGEGWPSYAINNVGTLTISDSKVTSFHGGLCSYAEGAVITMNNTDLDMAGIPGFSSHGLYTYNGGKIVVNGGNIANKATDQNATGASVINGNVEVNSGNFSGRIENYNGTPVLKGGTYTENPKAAFVAEDYVVEDNGDGTYTVTPRPVTGKVSYRPYILNGSRQAIQIDMEQIFARESLVVELWHDDTLLTTTTYLGSYPYDKPGYTTCCVALKGAFFSWETVIADGVVLTADNVPNMIKVYADGTLTDTFTHSSGTVFADKVNEYLALDALQQ